MSSQSSSRISRWAKLTLITTTILGIPISALAIFKRETPKHLGLTLFCLACYEVVILASGLGIKVWTKLEGKWVDHIADWLDWKFSNIAQEVLSRLSRYRRSYLEWVFFQNRDFDVKGLTTQGTFSLELEQVFVDLILDPRPAHATSPDPVRKLTAAPPGRMEVWKYIEKEGNTGNSFAVLGAPGSGKTTLLKEIAIQMAREKRPRLRHMIPILLLLREHSDAIHNDPNHTLLTAIDNTIGKRSGPVPPKRWFKMQLMAGRCLLLLDGLDEVAASEVRQTVARWIEQQLKTYPKCRILITSRPYGYRSNPIEGMSVLEVQPFTRDQVQRFVHNWYRANETRAWGGSDPGVDMKAREGAQDLLRRLISTPLNDLAVNPLLLTMISTVHRYRSSLPGRRVELYSEICDVFLGKRQLAKGMELDLAPSQKQRVLQFFAYRLMLNEERELPAADVAEIISQPLLRVVGRKGSSAIESFLKSIEETSGLILEREAGVYGFAHLAFQEYLAAVHIREQGLATDLVKRISDPWWQEVIRLYAAQGDATPLLRSCLMSNHPTSQAMTLAIDCIEEAREVDPEYRDRLEELISDALDDAAAEIFDIAAETLLTRRLRDMPSIDENLFIDNSYITNAEFQLFLNNLQSSGQYKYPDHWRSIKFRSGEGRKPILGIRHSDAKLFCHWLETRFSSWRFRLPREKEIEQSDALHISTSTAEPIGYWLDSEQAKFAGLTSNTQLAIREDYISEIVTRDLSSEFRRIIGQNLVNIYEALERYKRPDRNTDSTTSLEVAINSARRRSLVHDLVSEIAATLSRNSFTYLDLDQEFVTSERTSKHDLKHDGYASRIVPDPYPDFRTVARSSADTRVLPRSPSQESIDFGISRHQKRLNERARRIPLHHEGSLFTSLSYLVKVVLERQWMATPEIGPLLRWGIRVIALDIWKSAKDSQDYAVEKELVNLLSSFILVESRHEGIAIAVETIRVVKERRT